MAKKTTKTTGELDKSKIVETALQLAVDLGWERVTLQDIAESAGVTLAQLFDAFCDKDDILVELGRMIDRRVLDGAATPDPSLSARDMLFDILMDRFEALNDHREGVVAVLRSFRYDPKQIIISMPHICRSMTWMLEAAGIETTGYKGAIKVAGLTGVYVKTLRVWKSDDSADLSKTMAALDKDLGRVESFANTFGF